MDVESKRLRNVWTAVGVVVLLGVGLWLVGRLWPALVPLVLGIAIYVILKPLADRLACRGMSERSAALVSVLAGFLVLIFTLAITVPLVAHQASSMLSGIPDAINRVNDLAEEMVESGSVGSLSIPKPVLPQVRREFDSLLDSAVTLAQEVGTRALEGVAKVGELLLNVLIAFIIAYWLIRDATRLKSEVVRVAGEHGARVDNVLNTSTRVAAGYLRGQALACASTSAMVAVCLSVLGVPGALAIAGLTFFLDFIPYLGAATSAILAVIAGLFGNWYGIPPLYSALLAGGLVVLSRWMTDVLVIPKVMSDEVNIHPIIVIASLLVGATAFGAPGLIMAIPVAGILQGMLVYWWETKTGEELVTRDGALFRSCPTPESDS